MLIDAKRLACPQPVLIAEEALNELTEGMIELLVDNEGAADNLSRFARKNGFFSEKVKEGNQWRVKIVKGSICAVPEEEKTQKQEKHLMLVVSTDSLGKDETLGRMLIKGFFETMRVTEEIPATIFFVNAGVKLTTTNVETIPVLKELEGMGMEIYSCGTCLKYYNLEAELKVGLRGMTTQILEGMTDCAKVVWI